VNAGSVLSDIGVSGVDIVFGVIMLVFGTRAAFRGFIKEAMSIAAVFLGVLAAVLFSGLVASLIDTYVEINLGRWTQVISFLLVFLLAFILVKLFESALTNVVENLKLGAVNHTLGFLFGLLEGILIVFVLILLIQAQPVFDPEPILADSLIARILAPLMPQVRELIRTHTEVPATDA
jgi:membrane protein required for colicin V production